MSKFKLQKGLNYCSNAEYHGDKSYLSSSVLKTIYKSLEKYELEYLKGIKEPISSDTEKNFSEGSLAHAYILEPYTVQSDFNFYTESLMKKGPLFTAFKESVANSNPIISIAQNERVLKWVAAYKAHPVAPSLITGGFAEQTVCGELYGVPLKTRYDYINVDKGYIADVKTTGYGSDLDSFKQTVECLMYGLSAALYCQIAEQHYGKPFDFYFIVLSKNQLTCDVYKTSEETMNTGKRIVQEACTKYKKALKSGIWVDDLAIKTVDQNEQYEILEI